MMRPESRAGPFLWLCALLGLGAGLAAMRLAEMPDRWVVAGLAGALAVAVILVTGRPRLAALSLFVLSLQVGLALYLTEPPPVSGVGASWPNSLALPLPFLTAVGAFAAGRRRPLAWGGGFSIAAVLLALTTAASVPGSPVRFIGLAHLVVVLAYFAIFLTAANVVKEAADLDLVWRLLMASLVLQSVLYFVQVAAGGTFTPAGEWIPRDHAELGRYGGSVGARPAVFSSFLLPLLLLAVSRFLTSSARPSSGLVAALGSAALLLTFTRASWIAFGLGLLYLLGAGARRGLLVRRNVAVLPVILAMAALALSPGIAARAADDHSAAFEERWALVQMALRVIGAHPVLGVGAGAYPYVFQAYLTPELADRWLFVVHNVYVLRAAETGLPGVAALLLLLWIAFRQASPDGLAAPSARTMALGWRAGLIALGWEMLWDVSLGPAANSLLWFLCGVMVAAREIQE